jgi:hypothetical protein
MSDIALCVTLDCPVSPTCRRHPLRWPETNGKRLVWIGPAYGPDGCVEYLPVSEPAQDVEVRVK